MTFSYTYVLPAFPNGNQSWRKTWKGQIYYFFFSREPESHQQRPRARNRSCAQPHSKDVPTDKRRQGIILDCREGGQAATNRDVRTGPGQLGPKAVLSMPVLFTIQMENLTTLAIGDNPEHSICFQVWRKERDLRDGGTDRQCWLLNFLDGRKGYLR